MYAGGATGLTELTRLTLTNNAFSGTIPTGLGGPKLQELRLALNNLTGGVGRLVCWQ